MGFNSGFKGLSMLRFHENVKTVSLFCGHDILTEGVFVTQRYSSGDLSLTDCVGYE